jgi:hypothetical protein
VRAEKEEEGMEQAAYAVAAISITSMGMAERRLRRFA